MNDHAFSMLVQQLNNHKNTPALWLVDENISLEKLSLVAVNPVLTVISNRYDNYVALKSKGFSVMLSDFDFSQFPENSVDIIYYRVSKEKAIVHHIVNSAGVCLKPSGQLVLAGYKNEGIKSYVDKAGKYLGSHIEKNRGSNASLLACLTKEKLGAQLDDKNYNSSINIDDDGCELKSKPGVYGWNKVDIGSRLLIDCLSLYLDKKENSQNKNLYIMDLGCGYGYLSIKASYLLSGKFIATDNNITAISLCKKNYEEHGIQGDVIVDDCASSITQQVDMVLCNPPFHQGFDTVGDLTLRFLQSAHRVLKRGGSAFFVVNSFISIEKQAKKLFSEIISLKNNGSFKVILLVK